MYVLVATVHAQAYATIAYGTKRTRWKDGRMEGWREGKGGCILWIPPWSITHTHSHTHNIYHHQGQPRVVVVVVVAAAAENALGN